MVDGTPVDGTSQVTEAQAEPEITVPVDLCMGGGRLNPAAVGWSRQPLHRCGLPGSWGRRKRWDFWGIMAPGHVLNLVVADVDYVGVVDVWFCDLETGRLVTKAAMVPLAQGIDMPRQVGAHSIRYRGQGLDVAIEEVPGGTQLRASFGEGAGRVEADVQVRRPAGHESLGVVIPWSERRFQYTNKDVARPAEGQVTWGDRTYDFAPDGTSWGCLDFGRGKWPYRTKWNWGAAAGVVGDGPRGPATVGLQLGGKWTDGTGMTENALCVDGRLTKVSEELTWSYDTGHWLEPWSIRSLGSDRIDLTFTPIHDKVTRLQLGVAAQSVDQCFGVYRGTIRPEGSEPMAVDGLYGWAEEATWRW